ncbi:MAG: glutaredoxin 3 [Candidatus Marinimicrobia bacterium]|nr:glutaredoxin 3 [Candidatus Neomarinimicrobiota bacterium]
MSDTKTPVTLYTTLFCPYCHGAKRLLEEKGIPYEAVDLSGKPNFRQFLVEKTGRRSIPQILIHGIPVGGYTELLQLDQSGKLDEMLNESFSKEQK